METEKILGLIAIGWLAGANILFVRLIRRGRLLTEELATRYPETYEALGRPRPGVLYSDRWSRFSRFLARREYENLDDPALAARFDAYRRAEARLLLILLVSLGIVALLVLIVTRAA